MTNIRKAARDLWRLYHCFTLPDAPKRGEVDEAWDKLKAELDRPERLSAGKAALLVLVLSGLLWAAVLALVAYLWK
jgi:fatty acid desaturase